MVNQKNKKEPEVEILEKKNEPEKKKLVRSVTVSTSWEAPYPPPEILSKYSKSDKKEIFKAVEAERKHRHKQENKLVDSGIETSSNALNYTFILLGLGLLCGSFLIVQDKDVLGIATILGTSSLPVGSKILKLVRDWREISKNAKDDHDEHVRQTD